MRSLPRPKSIFDAPSQRHHPSVATGVILNTHIDHYRNVLGLICPGARHVTHRVIMRGVPGEPENDALVDAASRLSRKMTEWLNANTYIMIRDGTIYGYGDVPLASVIDLPEFDPVTVDGWTVTGRIEERRNPDMEAQGDPQYVYIKHIFLQPPTPGEVPLECKPVVNGQRWM